MTHQLAVSDSELSLILDLLECDQKKLLVEIRHTDTKEFREGLRDRLARIESLIERARQPENTVRQ